MPFLDSMPASLDSQSAEGSFAAFRCEHPSDVLALLRQLRDGAVPVALSGPGGANLGATLWTVDSDHNRITFDVEPGDSRLAGLVERNEATAVAYLDAVKLQFDLHGLLLVRNPRASALQARLPRQLYRFQRRASYRVRPPERSAPVARLRHPALADMTLSLRILDLSVGGCALLLPDDVPSLPLGATLHAVELVLDSQTTIDVTLRLQHASSVQDGAAGLRLGCELLHLAPITERELQRHIDQTQKRRRLLALD